MRFDGRFLHGAPSSRRIDREAAPAVTTCTRTAATGAPDDDADDEEEVDATRYTFLVNIWLNHRPVCSRTCPEATVERMSKLLELDASTGRCYQTSPELLPTAAAPLLEPDALQPDLIIVDERPEQDSSVGFVSSVCQNGTDRDDNTCGPERFATNDVGTNDPHVFECMMPTLGFCEEGLAQGMDNFAVADRSAGAEASSWLKKKEAAVAANTTEGRGGSKRPRPAA